MNLTHHRVNVQKDMTAHEYIAACLLSVMKYLQPHPDLFMGCLCAFCRKIRRAQVEPADLSSLAIEAISEIRSAWDPDRFQKLVLCPDELRS